MKLLDKRKSSRALYYRQKYARQFRDAPQSRHWCFEYIRSDDALVDTSGRAGRMFARLNIEKQLSFRLARFFKKLKAKQRERRIKRHQDNAIVDELANCPSSEISKLGSTYEEYDIDKMNIHTGKVMIPDAESDFDMRVQAKIWRWFKPKNVGKRRIYRIPDVWETMYEEHMIKRNKQWYTRAQLRKARITNVTERFRELFMKAMRHGRSKVVLSSTEFYLCLLLYEFNMSQLVSFGHAFNQGGVGAAVVIYLLVSTLIQMPFNMWIISMVSYSGSLSLRLFTDCMPLVSAIKYPIFLAFIIAESRRLLNIEAVVKFMFLTFIKGKVWKNCTLESANEYCVPFITQMEHNVKCTKTRERDSNYEFFSTQYFVQYDVLQIGNVGQKLDENVKYWGDPASKYYGPVLGIVGFLIASNGIGMLKKVTIKAQVLVIVLAGICVVSVAINNFRFLESFVWNYTNITIKFVVNFVSISLQTNSLPILMWLASMKPPHLNPATCSVVHQAIKFLVLMLMSITYSALAFDISMRYNMKNIACFTLEGYDIVFAMAPDFFATFRFSTIWQSTWLICMILIAVIYSVYMILAASDSLIQIIPNGDAYATLFMFLVTLTVIGFRLINEFPYVYQTLISFELRGLNYINNFNFGLLVLCTYFVYTPLRLSHEYEFTFGSPPARFWVVSWHFMIFIALLVLVLTVTDLFKLETKVVVQYILAAIFIVCALWLFLIHCIKLCYKGIKIKSLNELCYPNYRWGPPSKEQREAQLRLERKQNLAIRYHCRHKCFMNLPQFDNLDKQQDKQVLKIETLRRTAVYSWYLRETLLKEETVLFFNNSIVED